MEKLLKEKFLKYGFNLSEKQINRLTIYYNFLIEENKKYNLTNITQQEEVIIKHFIDSALGVNLIKKNSTVIDVGTGAGFPGLVLKILREDIKLTLLDSLQKRINFLNTLLIKLDIKDVIIVHARCEDYCVSHRESFDIALSRAVAPLVTLSEYLLPFVKVGGAVLMYKGVKINEELKEGSKAIKLLGGQIKQTHKFILAEEGERYILEIEKVSKTDKKYPRGKNQPRLKPIK